MNWSPEFQFLKKQNQIETCFQSFFSLLNIFKESRTCHYRGPEQCKLWKRLLKCKHVYFISVGLKFPLGWLTLNSKPYAEVANFELKSYPKGWEVWPQIFIFDQSPHPIPWSPLTHFMTCHMSIKNCQILRTLFWMNYKKRDDQNTSSLSNFRCLNKWKNFLLMFYKTQFNRFR